MIKGPTALGTGRENLEGGAGWEHWGRIGTVSSLKAGWTQPL
jgi:hypothetical protein